MMYVQDYDEKYPLNRGDRVLLGPQWATSVVPASNGGITNSNTIFWQYFLQPYAKSSQVFYCPSRIYKNDATYGNYGVNRLLIPDGATSATVSVSSVAMAAVDSPATTYMIMDSGLYRLNAADVYNPGVGGNFIPGTGPGSADNAHSIAFSSSLADLDADYKSGRHFGGVNMAFADGHVKWMQSQTVRAEAIKCKTSGATCNNGAIASAWNPMKN